MPYARIRGIDLYFEDCGSGPVLVVAHGALGSVATTPQSGFLPTEIAARGFRVVSHGARSHGRSGYSPQSEDYRRGGRAADLLGLMDALGIPRTAPPESLQLRSGSRSGRLPATILRLPTATRYCFSPYQRWPETSAVFRPTQNGLSQDRRTQVFQDRVPTAAGPRPNLSRGLSLVGAAPTSDFKTSRSYLRVRCLKITVRPQRARSVDAWSPVTCI